MATGFVLYTLYLISKKIKNRKGECNKHEIYRLLSEIFKDVLKEKYIRDGMPTMSSKNYNEIYTFNVPDTPFENKKEFQIFSEKLNKRIEKEILFMKNHDFIYTNNIKENVDKIKKLLLKCKNTTEVDNLLKSLESNIRAFGSLKRKKYYLSPNLQTIL